MVSFKIFISHTNGPEDMTVVRQLASHLQLADVVVYVAEDDRQPGKYISKKIKENILSSDWVIGLWTMDSSKSAYVNQELGFAEDKKPIALFVQKGVTVKGFYEGKEHIPFDPSDPTSGLLELAQTLQTRKTQKDGDAAAAGVFFGIIMLILGLLIIAALTQGKGGS